MEILADPATSGHPAESASRVPPYAPALRSWAAVKAGTRVRMSLGAKSRRRRRPQAAAWGHFPPREFAPDPPVDKAATLSPHRLRRALTRSLAPTPPSGRRRDAPLLSSPPPAPQRHPPPPL